MIVISLALVLSPSDDEPLNNPVLGWYSLATEDNLTTTTEAAGFPAIHLHNNSTNLVWQGTSIVADEYITVMLDETQTDPIDYVAVCRHNFGSAGIVVSVEVLSGDESPIDWVEVVEETVLGDDKPIILRFVPQSVLGVRLRLQPGTEVPEAGIFYTGKLLVFQQGVQGDYTPLPYGRVANVVNGRSERGDFLGRIIVGSHTESTATFLGLTAEWVRETLEPFLEVSAERPFFFAWAPEDYPLEVGFAWLENDPQPAFDIHGYTAVEFRMTGVVQ